MLYMKMLGLLILACFSVSPQQLDENIRFVVLSTSSHLYLVDGREVTQITDDWTVAFTVRDDEILVITDTADGQNILVYDLNGAFQYAMTDFDTSDTPIWIDIAHIPFSDELIAEFDRIEARESGLYRFDPSNSPLDFSFIGPARYSNPDVSSDGRYLVFDRGTQRQTDLGTPFINLSIVLYNLETTEWVYITSELQGRCGGAQWHPNQNIIVYSCSRDSTQYIYLTNIDTAETELIPLPPDVTLLGRDVVWAPDGSSIAFNTDKGIAILFLDGMTFEFFGLSELIGDGIVCMEWIP